MAYTSNPGRGFVSVENALKQLSTFWGGMGNFYVKFRPGTYYVTNFTDHQSIPTLLTPDAELLLLSGFDYPVERKERLAGEAMGATIRVLDDGFISLETGHVPFFGEQFKLRKEEILKIVRKPGVLGKMFGAAEKVIYESAQSEKGT